MFTSPVLFATTSKTLTDLTADTTELTEEVLSTEAIAQECGVTRSIEVSNLLSPGARTNIESFLSLDGGDPESITINFDGINDLTDDDVTYDAAVACFDYRIKSEYENTYSTLTYAD